MKHFKNQLSFLLKSYKIALPLILSVSLGNILEVTDLSISSLIDDEIVKSISLMERYRFFFGAILIAFTSVLNIFLNRSFGSNDFKRAAVLFKTIYTLTKGLGLILFILFLIAVLFFAESSSPLWIYGIGTSFNILFMFVSTPWYIVLISSKSTGTIFKVSLFVTLFNLALTWILAKELGLKTFGIIVPTVLSNLMAYLFFRYEALKSEFFMEESNFSKVEAIKSWKFIKNNLWGNLFVCFADLFLMICVLKIESIAVLYGLFFALDKLFNGVTQAVSNTIGVDIARDIEQYQKRILLNNYLKFGTWNALLITTLSLTTLFSYQKFTSLIDVFIPIVIIVMAKSMATFIQKGILRQGGDLRWIKRVNIFSNFIPKMFISIFLLLNSNSDMPIMFIFFSLLAIQSLIVVILTFKRLLSNKWLHKV